MSAITDYVGSGMVSKKERDNLRTGKERRLDMQRHHDGMIKENANERAKKWFNRRPYSIRGDVTNGPKHKERK